jgi:tight adherence protein B
MSGNAGAAGLVVAVLVLLVALAWPARRPPAGARLVRAAARQGEAGAGPRRGGSFWHEDPVALLRRRRARLGGEPFEAALLALLDAVAAALRAGLPPVRALELGAATLPDDAPPELLDLVAAAVAASGDGLAVATVWRGVADAGRSPVLHTVAAAWGLSESTGCPLAEAVERAAAELRSALVARRKVRAAVAGPEATVTVLTVLPLTGPIFGLACGMQPGELYGNPVALACLVGGLTLLWVGRRWCRRLVRRAESAA